MNLMTCISAEALHHILESRIHGIRWPMMHLHVTDLVTSLTKRANEASAIYQMFGILGDVVLLNRFKLINVRGHSFNTFTQISDIATNLLRTKYDVTMTMIHWRTNSAWSNLRCVRSTCTY